MAGHQKSCTAHQAGHQYCNNMMLRFTYLNFSSYQCALNYMLPLSVFIARINIQTTKILQNVTRVMNEEGKSRRPPANPAGSPGK